MVWCLLVVPNYCMVDPLAKVNKTAKQPQFPFILIIIRHIESYAYWQYECNPGFVLLILAIQWRNSWLQLDFFLLFYFMVNWKGGYAFEFLQPQCLPQGLLNVLWVLWNTLPGIKIFCVKIAPPLFSDDSGCSLLCAPIQTYYVFMSTSFTCHKAPSLCCRLSFLS